MKENTINLEKSSFDTEIDKFLQQVEAQSESAPLVFKLLIVRAIQEQRNVDKFIKDNNISITKDENAENKEIKIDIPISLYKDFSRLIEQTRTALLAFELIPINFIVSFVSLYDAFLGGIIRNIFAVKPELLHHSEKNISFSDLMKFKSLKEAKDIIVEKEVETILRENHYKQIKWFENKLGMTLTKDLDIFSDFIEITERRNLFVHSNGVVSRQYLQICNEHKVENIENIKVGTKLSADPQYFQKCYSILLEIAVKLGQVIWRKLKPEDLEKADKHLNDICYHLLVKEDYDLAFKLLVFGTEILKKHSSQEILCIMTINKALACYLANKKEESNNIIDKFDWSATNDVFKLAVAVLKEDYTKAIVHMRILGRTHEYLNKNSYREWPLFKKFRKTKEFTQTYQEIFGEELKYTETKPKDLDDILKEMKSLKEEKYIKKIISESSKNKG